MAFLQGLLGETGLLLLGITALVEVPAVLSAGRILADTWARVQGGESPKVGELVWLAFLGIVLGGLFLIGAQFGLVFVGAQAALAAVALIVALGLRTVGQLLENWKLLPTVIGGAMVVVGLAILGKQVGSGKFGEDLKTAAGLVLGGGIVLISGLRQLMGMGPSPRDQLERLGSEYDPEEEDDDTPPQ